MSYKSYYVSLISMLSHKAEYGQPQIPEINKETKHDAMEFVTKNEIKNIDERRIKGFTRPAHFPGRKGTLVTENSMFINLKGGKNDVIQIDFDTLCFASQKDKQVLVTMNDGHLISLEMKNDKTANFYAGFLMRIADASSGYDWITGQSKIKKIPLQMITSKAVDFAFPKFTMKEQLPDDFEMIEKMYLGYKSLMGTKDELPGNHMMAIKIWLLMHDITMKYADLKYDFAMKLIEPASSTGLYEALRATKLGDQFRAEVILHVTNSCRHLSSVVSVIWSEIIRDKMKNYLNIGWFKLVMKGLLDRAEKEKEEALDPVGYAAYRFFNPERKELEETQLYGLVYTNSLEIPTVYAMYPQKFFGVHEYYTKIAKYCPHAELMRYSFEDKKISHRYLEHDHEEYTDTLRVKNTYAPSLTQTWDKYDTALSCRALNGSNAKNYRYMAEQNALKGDLFFTCMLCEVGEDESKKEDQKWFEQRDALYAKLKDEVKTMDFEALKKLPEELIKEYERIREERRNRK